MAEITQSQLAEIRPTVEQFRAHLEWAARECNYLECSTVERINWQNLVCMGIPIYNIFAALYGLPVLPLPAFCSNPAPTETP